MIKEKNNKRGKKENKEEKKIKRKLLNDQGENN